MLLSKRERYLAFGSVAAVILIAGYPLLVQPLLDERSTLGLQLREKQKEIALAQHTIQGSRKPVTAWKNASQAQSETEKAIEGWRYRSGDDRRPLKVTKLRPDPNPEKDKYFYKLTEHVEAEGTNEQIGRFLFQLQTASIPVRILDVSIRPKAEATARSGRESTTERVLTLSVGTIFTEPDADKDKRGEAGARETGR